MIFTDSGHFLLVETGYDDFKLNKCNFLSSSAEPMVTSNFNSTWMLFYIRH